MAARIFNDPGFDVRPAGQPLIFSIDDTGTTPDRFVVIALERVDSLFNNVSRILLAVSDDENPFGTWYYVAINSNVNIGGAAWADYPGLAIDEEAVYITANMFRFQRIPPVDSGKRG